jgi:hypothetical protein
MHLLIFYMRLIVRSQKFQKFHRRGQTRFRSSFVFLVVILTRVTLIYSKRFIQCLISQTNAPSRFSELLLQFFVLLLRLLLRINNFSLNCLIYPLKQF